MNLHYQQPRAFYNNWKPGQPNLGDVDHPNQQAFNPHVSHLPPEACMQTQLFLLVFHYNSSLEIQLTNYFHYKIRDIFMHNLRSIVNIFSEIIWIQNLCEHKNIGIAA